MKSRLLLFTLLFFASTQLLGSDQIVPADCKNCKLNLFQKAWEYKKKIVAAVVTSLILVFFRFYKAQGKWHSLADDFSNKVKKNDFWSKKNTEIAVNTLADFTYSSWFVLPHQKQIVAGMIKLVGKS
jgi:hypothetical protein